MAEIMKERIKRFSQYMEYKGLNDNQVTIQCGLGVGVIGGAKAGKSDLGARTIAKILEKYQDLNRVWLLTGEGEMLNESDNEEKETKVITMKPTGNIRYWEDVAATGGSPEFLMNPNEHDVRMIDVPNYGDCTDAVNIYGDSMFPMYQTGDVIILKEWFESFIIYGLAYLIVTKLGNRMVKILRKSEDESKIICHSVNKDFDDFEIKKSDILRLFVVKGRISKSDM